MTFAKIWELSYIQIQNPSTDGALAAGGDFIGVTCLTTFTAGSGPGNFSTPACNITITNDFLVEQDETFSLNGSIQNSNGQSAQFSAGGDSASATITDDDGMLVQLLSGCRQHLLDTSYCSK